MQWLWNEIKEWLISALGKERADKVLGILTPQRVTIGALTLALFLSACSPSPEDAWEAYQAAEAARKAASDEWYQARDTMEAAGKKAQDARRGRDLSREHFRAWKAAKAEYDAALAEYDAANEVSNAASEASDKAKKAWLAAEE